MLVQVKKLIWPKTNGLRQPDDDTFAIMDAHTADYGDVRVKGPIRGLIKGEWIEVLDSRLESHPKFGQTIVINKFRRATPDYKQADRGTMVKWLSSRIPGVGVKTAEQILDEVGIEYLLENPTVLQDYVLPRYRSDAMDAWNQVNNSLALDTLLDSVGISGRRREDLIAQMGGGQRTLELLRSDPWSLAIKFPSLTFPVLDALAKTLDVDLEHPSRFSLCLQFSLQQMSQSSGDTMSLRKNLLNQTMRRLDLHPPEEREEELMLKLNTALTQNPEIEDLGPSWVASSGLYDAEKTVFYVLKELMDAPSLGIPESLIDKAAATGRLDKVQTQGLYTMNSNAVSLLTGGPGTGKTTTLGVFVKLCRDSGKNLVLVAPTGKAARRLGTVAKHPASTIHRWIGQVESGSFDDEETDMVIIDESSMISSTLMAKLLKTVVQVCGRCVLVGDENQLPPVEPGAPFKDLLRNNALPSVHLRKIWRQAGDSMIPVVANELKEGKSPVENQHVGKENAGWRYIECATPEEVEQETAIESIRQHQKYGLDGSVVLSAHYNHAAGVTALSGILQGVLNPDPVKSVRGEKTIWAVGDPVLHIGNKYDKGGKPDLTHAMLGHIGDIVTKDGIKFLAIDWEDDRRRYHPISKGDPVSLVSGYAFSYHRSQGSEYDGVVVAVSSLPKRTPDANMNLGVISREAIYTAVTRAKREVVLVAEAGVLPEALKVVGSSRKTILSAMLRQEAKARLSA